jgi:acetamidase/formamidase
VTSVVLQPGVGPIEGHHYLASDPDTVLWGWLPNAATLPVLRVAAGEVVTVDTMSHEGILEDFGHDPVAWFGAQGVARSDVLADAIDIAANVAHDEVNAGPHVVTGPIHVEGAAPGDLLVVDVLGLRTRVPYGVVSTRHGLGSLAGEYPLDPRLDGASPAFPKRYGTTSVFTTVVERDGRQHGEMRYGEGRAVRFPLGPFLGVMGVSPATTEPVHSVPPGPHGGNIDVKWLVAGSRLYLPVQVDGAGFYVGDPHFAQGNGEVCLTALEGSLRADLRLSVLRGPEAASAVGVINQPFVETDEHWVPVGLDVDLDEALRKAVRAAISFLTARFDMPAPIAYSYLSAAADFEVTQVVDQVKGVHCMLRKRDFEA